MHVSDQMNLADGESFRLLEAVLVNKLSSCSCLTTPPVSMKPLKMKEEGGE